MSDYKFKRGMRPPTEVPGRNRKMFDSALSYLTKPEIGKPIVLRPAGGVCTLGVHKIRFTKPDGSQSGFKVLCTDWDIERQEQRGTKRSCPICRDFSAYGLPKDIKIPLVFSYLFHAFNVTNVKRGMEPAFGLVEANVMNWPEIVEATQLNNGVDLFDPKNGCCLNWTARQSKFAPGINETHFAIGNPLPIGWRDDAWKIKLRVGEEVKTASGEEQDILALLIESDSADIEESLERTGLYRKLEEMTGTKRKATFVAPQDLDVGEDFEDAPAAKTTANLDDPDLDDADDDLDTPPAKAPAKAPAKKPAKPAAKPAPVADDDDDFDDDDDAPPAPPVKAPAKKPAKPAPVADDDDDFDDDDDAPPAPPAKAPAKKAPAKPAAPADDDDDFDDDLDDAKPDPAKSKPIPGKKAAPKDDDDEWAND